jgi:electron transfer flavoprotein alpha subunit
MPDEKKLKRPAGIARLIPGKCIACGGYCQNDCPRDAIQLNEKGEPVVAADKCSGCRRCIKVCPAQALEIYFTPEEQKVLAEISQAAGERAAADKESAAKVLPSRLKEYRGVWVFVEQTGGVAAQVSWELLGAGSGLARKLGVELCSIVMGHQVENLCQESFAYGAARSYLIDDPVLHYYRTEPYYKSICYLVEKYKPEILLTGASGMGRDLAGAVATVLKTGLTADCTGLEIDDQGFLRQTRPAFGGNVMATILTEQTRPQMSTVRPHVMPMPVRDNSRVGQIVRETLPLKEQDIAVKVLKIIDESRGAGELDVAAAEVIVSGGRGMINKDNFKLLQELAVELGGVVGCSRAAVESGWMPVERQVGQTGKTVRPKIYIACGISGAIQHLVGMQDSEVIIAINRDRQAPIFEVATYGIVGDLFQIVPAITSGLRDRRKQAKEKSAALPGRPG